MSAAKPGGVVEDEANGFRRHPGMTDYLSRDLSITQGRGYDNQTSVGVPRAGVLGSGAGGRSKTEVTKSTGRGTVQVSVQYGRTR